MDLSRLETPAEVLLYELLSGLVRDMNKCLLCFFSAVLCRLFKWGVDVIIFVASRDAF